MSLNYSACTASISRALSIIYHELMLVPAGNATQGSTVDVNNHEAFVRSRRKVVVWFGQSSSLEPVWTWCHWKELCAAATLIGTSWPAVTVRWQIRNHNCHEYLGRPSFPISSWPFNAATQRVAIVGMSMTDVTSLYEVTQAVWQNKVRSLPCPTHKRLWWCRYRSRPCYITHAIWLHRTREQRN